MTMRIASINTFMPYIYGGAELVADDLEEQLQEYGHEVISLRIPFPQSYQAQLIVAIEAARLLCFDEFERVIAFNFPAYYIRHHAKVLWLSHQLRQVYDLWGEENGFQPGPENESIRKIIKAADEEEIPLSRHIYTNSLEVTNRLKQFNGIDSEVLWPPLKNHELYYSEKSGDYIFYPSRINSLKRQHLAIEAMVHVQSGVRLIIAGVCEGSYFEQLKSLIIENHLEKRVELRNEWISDEEKRLLIANSLGIVFIPYKEEYGLVTLEAFYSLKPVITCADSGGVTAFVNDGITGFEVHPDPQAIATAMDKLYFNKDLAERMGKAGLDEIIRRDITWSSTIRRLLL
jgi:glycosyltransferase involved in cell wall biosynthesis